MSTTDQALNHLPQATTIVTRTPGGGCQSTITLTLQVTTTLGPADAPTASGTPVVRQRSSDDDDTDPGSQSKGGLSGTERSPDEEETNIDPDPKGSGLSGRE